MMKLAGIFSDANHGGVVVAGLNGKRNSNALLDSPRRFLEVVLCPARV